ncbi:MAG: hypothetical protein JNM79_07115 [Burkholderiales bacterium]|nr:hypothetical protein [Burkholderiales bacterium]
MKTTLDLPDDIVQAVKLRAVLQRRPVKDLVAELLRNALGMLPARPSGETSGSTAFTIGANGIPVAVGKADAPASRMPVEALLQLEREAMASVERAHVGHPL